MLVPCTCGQQTNVRPGDRFQRGGMLRDIYSDLIEEETPEHLAQIVNRLEVQQTDRD